MPRESAKRFKSWKWTIYFRTIIGEFFSLLYEEENIGLRLNDNSICLFPNICSYRCKLLSLNFHFIKFQMILKSFIWNHIQLSIVFFILLMGDFNTYFLYQNSSGNKTKRSINIKTTHKNCFRLTAFLQSSITTLVTCQNFLAN